MKDWKWYDYGLIVVFALIGIGLWTEFYVLIGVAFILACACCGAGAGDGAE